MSEEITAAVNSATENSKEENESAKTGGKKMKITEEKLEVLIAILLCFGILSTTTCSTKNSHLQTATPKKPL